MNGAIEPLIIVKGGEYSFIHNDAIQTGIVDGDVKDDIHDEVYMKTQYTDEFGAACTKWYIIEKSLLFTPVDQVMN